MTRDTRYIDTRGHCSEAVPFTHAVVEGLAPGGGLFVPESLPHLDLTEILALAAKPYAQRAAAIYKAFNIDLPDETIDELMAQAYGGNFDDEAICPIHRLDDKTFMLELWHGPTSAFKDMALQCLPRFFATSAQKLRHEGVIDHEFLILVATSGDTGTAALEGFKDQPGVSIGVLYPHGGVSSIQYRQMATQDGDNQMVWAVEGNFDRCQSAAKTIFGDASFNEQLAKERSIALSSANSINWGRLLPQVVYYLSSYAQLVADGAIIAGEPIDVCVPTGNFGNILAAWYAKQIGAPIERLICASNENRVLTDFINTGVYDIADREFVLTPSPSMDILISSNLERQLFELTGRDADAIARWMQELKDKRRFSVGPEVLAALQAHFVSDSVTSVDCLKTIKEVARDFNYLLDPHSAVAYRVADRLRESRPVLVACTAHWAKFGENVYRALHDMAPGEALPAEIETMSGAELNQAIKASCPGSSIPRNLADLDERPVRFTTVIGDDVAAIETAIGAFLDVQASNPPRS